ncbi:cation:proton antiporter [Geotalea daltonii]|nr:cation:proton antiporter [Geotalea daltonii]
MAIFLLLTFAHICGYFFTLLRMPSVIGEIFGGFLLGPTVFGHFLPDLQNWVFNAFVAEGKLISIVYWFGLILLMFISGFEIQNYLNQKNNKLVFGLTIGSTIIPFIAGWFLPICFDLTPYVGDKHSLLALQLIIAIATAVTSIPVISKIFIELNIVSTPFANVVLAAATIHDLVVWIALAIAGDLVAARTINLSEIVLKLVITIAFFIVFLKIIPRAIMFLNGSKWNVVARSSIVGYVMAVCLFLVAIASMLGVNLVFGALLAGIVVGMAKEPEFINVKKHIREFSLAFFVPLYFAIVGLKLNLIRDFDPLFLGWFLLYMTFFQMAGCLVATRMLRVDWFSSVNLGIAMSTKGGPLIVLATVALDLGIVSSSFSASLILIAIITSAFAGAWFRYIIKNDLRLLKV